jgi:DNA-binding NtrC family response regulator
MTHKILFVDDDPNILAAFKRQLRKKFHIDTAKSPEEGLKAVRENGPYAVIISDLRMPGMDGNQFLYRVRDITPDSVRILLTGHADLQAAMNAINSGNIFRLLTKPCPSEVLLDALASGVEQHIKKRQMGKRDEQRKPYHAEKKILVVDDDPVIRSVIRDALKPDPELEVLTAENGKEAVKHLKEQPLDLVVTDLKMPVMNGLKLLAFMKQYYPEIPAIVMTGYGNAKLEKGIEAHDDFQYFEKPLDIGVLIEMIFKVVNSRTISQIHGISLSALLQLMDNEQKTCTLKIRSQDKTGYLYISEGDLIAAETENLKAEEAAYRIINWENAVIEIENVCRKKENEIHMPLMKVIMESARIMDEMKAENS